MHKKIKVGKKTHYILYGVGVSVGLDKMDNPSVIDIAKLCLESGARREKYENPENGRIQTEYTPEEAEYIADSSEDLAAVVYAVQGDRKKRSLYRRSTRHKRKKR